MLSWSKLADVSTRLANAGAKDKNIEKIGFDHVAADGFDAERELQFLPSRTWRFLRLARRS
jgi:hypothetical protein